jgi:importin-7
MFKRKSGFVGSKTLNFNIKYVAAATKLQKTMAKLLPFIENILYETVMPIMLVTHKDVTLFQEDPIEYIRKQLDFTETLFMPKNTVIDLLMYICSYTSTPKTKGKKQKRKPDYLFPFLNFAVSNMQQYQDQLSQGHHPDWRIKEALLCSIGHLEELIMSHEELSSQMEPMLIQHVLNELQSSQPFLRSRACWIYGEFKMVEFADEANFKNAIDGIYKNLFAPELPVRLSAATSLSKLLNKGIT